MLNLLFVWIEVDQLVCFILLKIEQQSEKQVQLQQRNKQLDIELKHQTKLAGMVQLILYILTFFNIIRLPRECEYFIYYPANDWM